MYDSVAVAARPRAVEMVIPMVDVVRTVVDLQFVTAVAASSGALDGPAHDVIDTAADPDEHLVLGTHRLRDVGLEGEADDAALERRERKACRIDLDARRSGARCLDLDLRRFDAAICDAQSQSGRAACADVRRHRSV